MNKEDKAKSTESPELDDLVRLGVFEDMVEIAQELGKRKKEKMPSFFWNTFFMVLTVVALLITGITVLTLI